MINRFSKGYAFSGRNMINRVSVISDLRTKKIIVQTPFPPINCLVIEGGGSRCPAYIGAYRAMHESGMMDDVKYISASSGGAMAGWAIASDYGPDEAEAIMLDLDLEHFLEGGRSALLASTLYEKGKVLLSILRSEKYSLSSGNEFLLWLQKNVEKKMGNKHATFRDLENRVKADGRKFKYLYVAATNLSLQIPEYKIFSHETTPDMELAIAIYMSSCIPGVWPLVEYDGCLWGDGGIMNNLPIKIFDDRRFLPKGYDFNDRGMNPGVLAIKVDSKAEINQELYGIVKKVDMSSASSVATQLCNALSQNTDITEIREARLSIALPDNDIGCLEFTVNVDGKIGLISGAGIVTRNFIENYYNAAYEIKTYDNIKDWLDTLSIDEVIDLSVKYKELNKKYEVKPIEIKPIIKVIESKAIEPIIKPNDEIDSNLLTYNEIREYRRFLKYYLSYRIRLKTNPEYQLKAPLPERHINLIPDSNKNKWSENVEKEMQEKLKSIKKQIIHINQKIGSMQMEFIHTPAIHEYTLLHDKFHFDNIQALTNYVEAQKVFYDEKNDLIIKLGLNTNQKPVKSDDNSNDYYKFITILNPLLSSASIAKDLQDVLPESLPVFQFQAKCEKRWNIFSLDLRNETDRKLYIIAALMYLQYNKSKNKDIFVKLYQEFVSTKITFPQDMIDLKIIFNVGKVEVLMMAYKIEELLHLFERKASPKIEPSLNIDVMFGMDVFFKQYEELTQTRNDKVAMKHIIHSNSIFSHACDDESIKDSSDEDESEDDISLERYNKPSWFK